MRPEPLPHGHFGIQERAVARLWLSGKVGWGAILDNTPPVHDQHPIERLSLAYVMGDAEQSGLPPQLAGASEQLPSMLAVEPTAGLIQDDQPHPGPEHGPPESHPLAFSARYQSAPLAEPCLQPVGQPLQDTAQMGLGNDLPDGQGRVGWCTVGQIVEEGAVPELHSRIDPGRLPAQLCEVLAVERDTVNTNLATGWPIPPEERPDQARLPSP